MSWASLEHFLSMGGYGAYVWGAYLVCAVAVAFEVGLLSLRRRNIVGYLKMAGQKEP
jgi:heme exporter protein D